ncbi:MAG: acyl-CoA dehydrogenase [Thermodesulfobacteriota bacterium]
MAQMITDRRDIDFVLYEQLGIEGILKAPKYKGMNRKMFDLVVNEARNLAVKEIQPTYVEGDREGVTFDNGTVKVPECFHRVFDLFREGEWIALTKDPDRGGQGLPHVIAQAVTEYLVGANYAFLTYSILANGAGKMIELAGTEQQKRLFLKNLYTGKWGGTMVLTEPEAGSDVGNLTTTAVPNEDGTYSITGSKIFITNGEQDLTENIIHPVLARIEGAPKGTKGISLFLVPKIWVNDDGSPGEPNDVVCTGIEEKMGIHASPTCSLTFGGKGQCRGMLLGKENQGMKIMFLMMNEVRLEVGTQGFTQAAVAYMHALDYARERRQGRDLAAGKNPDAPQAPIIQHPDVRRMLLWMKAHVDGMRSLTYWVAHTFDRIECTEDPEERARLDHLVSLLTPVVKAYCSERGFEVCVQAMQVYGGYGYTRDYPVEQMARDSKIASIYEGTDGIQAMDLLGRKLGLNDGAAFMDLLGEMNQAVAVARERPELAEMADRVDLGIRRLGETALHIGKTARSDEFKTAFAHALPFLEVMGDLILAWMHLWRAGLAAPKLAKMLDDTTDPKERARIIAKKKEAAYYDGLVKTAAFFINTILPVTFGKMEAIRIGEAAAVDIDEKSFGG